MPNKTLGMIINNRLTRPSSKPSTGEMLDLMYGRMRKTRDEAEKPNSGFQGWMDASADAMGLLKAGLGASPMTPNAQPVDPQDPRKGFKGALSTPAENINNLANIGVGLSAGITSRFPKGFHSALEKAIEKRFPNIGLKEQLEAVVKSGGRADEIKWSGIQEFLDQLPAGAKVEKAKVIEHLNKGPKFTEVVKSGGAGEIKKLQQAALDAQTEFVAHARQMQQQYPTGNYPENLVDEHHRLGQVWSAAQDAVNNFEDMNHPQFERSELVLPGPYEDYKEILVQFKPGSKEVINQDEFYKWAVDEGYDLMKLYRNHPDEIQRVYDEFAKTKDKPLFTSSHFSEPNVLGHLRTNIRRTTTRTSTPDELKQLKEAEQTAKEAVENFNNYTRRGENWTRETDSQLWADNRAANENYIKLERELSKGDKVYHVDEFQSDWMNKGLKEGFQGDELPEGFTLIKSNPRGELKIIKRWNNAFEIVDDNNNTMYMASTKEGAKEKLAELQGREDWIILNRTGEPVTSWFKTKDETLNAFYGEKGTPKPGPLVQSGNISETLAKRAVLDAIEDPEIKYVTWTTGRQQADRYNSIADEIVWSIDPQGRYQYLPYKNGKELPNGGANNLNEKELREHLGEAAERIINGEGEVVKLPLKGRPIGLVSDDNYGWHIEREGETIHPQEGGWYADERDALDMLREEQHRWKKAQALNASGSRKRLKANEEGFFVKLGGKKTSYDNIFRRAMEKITGTKASKIALQRHYGDNKWRVSEVKEGLDTYYIIETESGHVSPTVDGFNTRAEAEAELNRLRAAGELEDPGQEVWGVKITPELRAKLLKEGLPFFAIPAMIGAGRSRKEKPLSGTPIPPPMF